jgi:hypothetical protein
MDEDGTVRYSIIDVSLQGNETFRTTILEAPCACNLIAIVVSRQGMEQWQHLRGRAPVLRMAYHPE